MNETLLSFPIDIGEVLDVDFRPDGGLLSVQGFGTRQVLVCPEGPAELPAQWPAAEFPHLRSIGNNRALLLDTNSDQVKGENAFILTETGRLEHRFHVGAGVIDVTLAAGVLAVAYHPDAAHEYGIETGPMAATGIAIFDPSGRMLATLNHDLEREGWSATNIQCLTARESGEIIFVPEFLKGPKTELDSPVVFYDWRTGQVRVEEVQLARPLAISSRGSHLLIYSPENSEDELILCDMKGRQVQSLGFFQQVFRGLPGGRFLAQVSGTQYRLIEMKQEPSARAEDSSGIFARHP